MMVMDAANICATVVLAVNMALALKDGDLHSFMGWTLATMLYIVR